MHIYMHSSNESPFPNTPLRHRYWDLMIAVLCLFYFSFVIYLAAGPFLPFGSLKGLYRVVMHSHHGFNVQVWGSGCVRIYINVLHAGYLYFQGGVGRTFLIIHFRTITSLKASHSSAPNLELSIEQTGKKAMQIAVKHVIDIVFSVVCFLWIG